nr:pentatricopeptide repeat-containing protein At1g30610, chloroplastic [Ipomoea batatas]
MVSAILTTQALNSPSSSIEFHCILGSNFIRCPCFSITGKPIYAIPIERSRLKNQRTSIGPVRIACALGNAIIDKKELDIKPSFNEYLKIMESVKENKKTVGDRSERVGQKRDSGEPGRQLRPVEKKKAISDSMPPNQMSGGEKIQIQSRTAKKPLLKPNNDNPRVEERNRVELMEMDRAAFKSMEEYGEDDAYDKLRVSKAEMEERIQMLARNLNGADIDIPEWKFSEMMRSAKIRFSDHSMSRIIQILGKLGNWRRVLQVIEWIQSRERFISYRIRYVYNAALDALGKAKRPVEALNLFREMQEDMSSYPDLVSYHSIAVTLGQAGHMEELFYVIESMRSPPKKKFKTGILEKWDPRLEPDNIIYNAVLNACVSCKNWEGALWVLQQLKQQGQQPSSVTYGLVMEVMLACGKYNLVHDYFIKLQKSCIPSALTYKVLINTLWKEGKTDEAILAVEDMERRGIVGTASLYYDLARCLCSAGRCQEALIQVDKICKVATKPLVVTYTGLIQACIDSGDVQSGVYVFNHMHKFCSPNLITYNILLKAYLDHELFEEAKQLFLGLLENGNRIRNKSDCKDMVLPDIHSFNLMLDGFSAQLKWDEVECIYLQMLKHGYHFNSKRHLRIVLHSCNAGKVGILEATWKHLDQVDKKPPPPLVKEMFLVLLGRWDFASALACVVARAPTESQVFSAKCWLQFLNGNRHRIETDKIVALLHEHELSMCSGRSENVLLENLMASCKEFLRTHSE